MTLYYFSEKKEKKKSKKKTIYHKHDDAPKIVHAVRRGKTIRRLPPSKKRSREPPSALQGVSKGVPRPGGARDDQAPPPRRTEEVPRV